MSKRLAAPLLVAVAGLLWLTGSADAAHCGSASYASCSTPCCEAQCGFSACQNSCNANYTVVYDTVMDDGGGRLAAGILAAFEGASAR